MAGALFSPVCVAQMRGGLHSAGRGARGFGGAFGGHRRDASARGYFVGETPFLYDDYPFAPAVPEPATPQFIVIPPPAAVDSPPIKTAPLLIELQGDRYVRYGGNARSADTGGTRHTSALETASHSPAAPSRLAQQYLPATVLIYRDGHREEIADYAIVGRVIYAHTANDDQTGYGMNNIQISTLDVPATVTANRERGVSFVLPAGPNEVVTRP